LALGGCEWSASYTSHFTLGKLPHCPLDKKLGGPQSWPRHGHEEKIPAPAGNTSDIQTVSHFSSISQCAYKRIV